MPAYILTPVLETLTEEEIKSSDPVVQERVKRVAERNAAIIRDYSALQYHADSVLAKWEPKDTGWNVGLGCVFPYHMELHGEDCKVFVEALANPPEPNEVLKTANDMLLRMQTLKKAQGQC